MEIRLAKPASRAGAGAWLSLAKTSLITIMSQPNYFEIVVISVNIFVRSFNVNSYNL